MGVKYFETGASPFVSSQNSNVSFNPQKIGSRYGNSGTPKPPKAPEKPLVPYMRFSRKIWDQVKRENPGARFIEIGKIVGDRWHGLSESEKSEYVEEYEAEKQEYDKKMASYKSTPAYQAYMQAKAKGLPVVEDPTPKGIFNQDRRIDIQPAEDEEDLDDGLSVKWMAHARFVRNHALMNEIFSEATVPEVRTVVTTQRMQVLKRQVHSLTMHQKKLEAELEQLEEKYNNKKRKFKESSETFSSELKKHCDGPVDEKKYHDMIISQVDKLRAEQDERARTGALTPPMSLHPQEPTQGRNVLKPVETIEAPREEDATEAKENGQGSKEEYHEMKNHVSAASNGQPAPGGAKPEAAPMMIANSAPVEPMDTK